ncbi:tyrosine-type recombinase/integrase [Telmatospirillum sp. J64-1]|uniref:tyrosine-type recombinase/integrase n=1 Tax=Telmatospirillum sp. J64-1 TaxID=2502183 RepID=UPI00115D814F|nr:tyrosine-type recombinase/integrase [Telmatospirillum sp. J64-1]
MDQPLLTSSTSGLLGQLSADEQQTLKDLLRAGTPENTLRAYAKDLVYLERWAEAATGRSLPWPAPAELVIRYLTHHLYRADLRSQAGYEHGMPRKVREIMAAHGYKVEDGPHAPSTVTRRLATWSKMHQIRGLDSPTLQPEVRALLRTLKRASTHVPAKKSRQAITAEMVQQMIDVCPETLQGIRDRALIAFAFASGGRRRSEIGRIQVADLQRAPDQLADPADPSSARLPVYAVAMTKTKTTDANLQGGSRKVWLVGQPAELLQQWLRVSQIDKGPVFRRVWHTGSRPETLDKKNGEKGWVIERLQKGLSGEAVAEIIKTRLAEAGYDPEQFSAHGLRSGFMTECANNNVPLQQAMSMSLHASVQVAAGYYQEAEGARSAAARLLATKKRESVDG